MDFSAIGLAAVLVAAVGSYAFGAVYYQVLGRPWREAVGKSEAEIKATMGPTPFVIGFVAQFVMAVVLSVIVNNLGLSGIEDCVTVALVIWLGFIVTTQAINHGFQGMPRALTIIDSGHWFGVLAIQGVAIGLLA